MKKKSTVFFDTFIGEFVDVISDLVETQRRETDQGITEMMKPLIIKGYVLDIDNDYVYLGETPNQVTYAVNKSTIKIITLAMDELDERLVNLPDPVNESEFN